MTTFALMILFGIMTFISVILLMATVIFGDFSNDSYDKIIFNEASMGIAFAMLFAISMVVHSC